MKTIYDALKAYENSDYYGFHMPGHKRNTELLHNQLPYGIDITEITGFDDLHHASGIIQQAEERAAALYHAEETHFLVNGSTAGILSAILGVTEKGDRIAVTRNCHKSVYHAVYMNELDSVYLYPGYEKESGLNGSVDAEAVRRILQKDKRIRAVVLVSPTYDGVVSDVEAVSEAAHTYGVPLIVDEAHGAHFGFHPYFPRNANEKGADIVIHSVHKTLPSLTQTALIHLNGALVNRERVRLYLRMLQSSSPSYVLLASIDECMKLLQEKGGEIFAQYVGRLCETRSALGQLVHLKLIETNCYDASKLLISVRGTNLTSRELAERLLGEYHLQMEMTAGDYVLAMTALGDTEEGFQRLVQALFEIDRTLCVQGEDRQCPKLPRAEVCCKSAEALARSGVCIPWRESVGRIVMEYAYLYPPGIPIVAPGERMTEEAAACLDWYEQHGFAIEGLEERGRIKVWRE